MPKSTNRTHLCTIIILLILFWNFMLYITSKEKQDIQTTKSVTILKHIHSRALYLNCKKKARLNAKTENTHIKLILLLLILSNDVNPNPGPKSPKLHPHSVKTNTKNCENCIMCNQELKNIEGVLQCQTCHKWCHLKCVAANKDELHNLRNFEWICPNKSCRPNHEETMHQMQKYTSPNRYGLPETPTTSREPEDVTVSRQSPQRSQLNQNSKQTNQFENYDQKLMKELPKISPRDYQGKDLCRSCYKEVKMTQPAISCDMCNMWIHRACSDMTSRLYQQMRKKSHFQWICNKCRKDEILNYSLADVGKLEKEDMPEEISKIKPSNNEMLILNINCRSILNKTEEIEQILNKLDPDIVCITETWLDNSVPAQGFIPDGYKIIRKDRSDDFKQKYGRNKGGGIAVLYKSHLKVEKKEYMSDKVEEILWVHVKRKQSFMLGVIYRSEYTDVMKVTEDGESKIEENVRKATEISDRIIITGDLNIDISDDNSNLTKELKNIYGSYGLTQLVKKPTRIDSKSGRPTIIDHVWTNTDHNLINRVGTFIGVSDHLGTYIKLNLKKQVAEVKKIKHRSYKNYDPQLFSNDLLENVTNSNIKQHIESRDVNSSTEELIKIIQQTADQHAPLIETKVGPKKNYIPWYNDELKNIIKQKNELIADNYLYGLKSFKIRINALSNRISHLKRKLKKKYITEKLTEFKDYPKKCWKIINLITNRTKIKDTVEPDTINQNTANSHNKYFATIGLEIQKKLQINTQIDDLTDLAGFTFKPETDDSINKVINIIRKDVATGADEIGAKLIKDAKNVLTPVLVEIINLGYQLAVFPDCMKKATIKPLHKKDDPDKISNYRPISILPTLSKVFEKAATDQLVEYLEKNNLLSKHQHAYRRGHSTQTCLAEVINYLYKLIDQKKYAAIVSLDLSKAFDSISHSLMLNKLAKQNLSTLTLHWIKSYLSNRKQRTKFQKYLSEEEPVAAGVPQGSIIGPLLFLCFTNDISEVFREKCKIVAYADDTQLLVDATSLNQLVKNIENIITVAQKWYTKNSMKNNIGKTEVLIINSRKENLINTSIKIKAEEESISLKPKSYIKILGILIDDQLNWSKQVNNVKSKSLNSIRNLHRVNHLLPTKLKVNLYNALIAPHFDYADVVWGGCGKINSQKLQVAQNFAAKSITGNRKYDSATDSLRKLKFLNLHQRRTIHETVYTHKSLLQLHPANTNTDYLQQRPTSNTRHSTMGKLNLPKHRTSKFQNSPLYRTIKSWNSCPDNIATDNIKTHKTLFQKYLINKTYKN